MSITRMNPSLMLNYVGFYQISKLSMIPVVCLMEWILHSKHYAVKVIMSVIMVAFGVGICIVIIEKLCLVSGNSKLDLQSELKLMTRCGLHVTFLSTKSMREEGGCEVIKKAIEKLRLRHKEHIAEGNERRLTSRHETADINTFKSDVAVRGASIRVGRDTEKGGKGYFEDRRSASNMDPYVVTSMITETTLLL